MEASSSRAAWLTALAVWAVSSGLAVFHYPVDQVGDGLEYTLMMLTMKHHRDPTITPGDIAAYNQLVEARPWRGGSKLTPAPVDPWLELPGSKEQRWDLRHIWVYSLMAVPFSWLCEVVGMHPMAGFAFLHAFLVLVTIAIARRWSGDMGALTAAMLMICSPYYWYSNKPHTEILTGAALMLATVGVATGRHAAAGLCLAASATQNMLLAPFAMTAIALDWRRLMNRDRATWLMAGASAAVVCLSPAYYFFRHGVANPLQRFGYIVPQLIGWKRIATLWVDPDRGILLLWPLALPLLLLSAWMMVGASRREEWHCLVKPLALFVASYLVLVQPGMAVQANWNMGGSYLVQRYTYWFVPLGWMALLHWLESLGGMNRTWRPVAAALLACLSLWSWWIYRPVMAESTVRFNAVSRWVYSTMPSVWDPDPEVFVERACGQEGYVTSAPHRIDRKRWFCLGLRAEEHNIWAASDPSCRKLYVSAEGLAAQAGRSEAGIIAGCPMVINRKFLESRILSEAPANGEDFYVSLEPGEARSMLPLLPLGEPIQFGTPEAVRYLGTGWSSTAGFGSWSDGDGSRILVRLPEPGGDHWKLMMEADGFVIDSRTQTVGIIVNGVETGRQIWHASGFRSFEIPNPSGVSGLIIDFVPSAPYEGDSPKVPDGRRLGIAIRKMWIEKR